MDGPARPTAVRAQTIRRTGATLAAAALLAATAACGGAGQDASAGSGSTSPTTSGASPASTSAPSFPAGRMTEGLTSPVRFERVGGIAGRRDRLEVRPDGTFVLTTGDSRPVTRQLSEAELAAVVSAAKAVDLRAQPAPTSPTAAVADGFRYRVSVQGRTITTTDEQADGAVRRLVDVLTPLFSAPAPTP
jgi:hypothetical protein